MRFQVPQFIETEEKIVGPFTLKQFFWVAGGAAILFILFISFSFAVFFLLGLPVAVVTGLMAFFKVQGVPLSTYIFHAISYFINPKKYYYK